MYTQTAKATKEAVIKAFDPVSLQIGETSLRQAQKGSVVISTQSDQEFETLKSSLASIA